MALDWVQAHWERVPRYRIWRYYVRGFRWRKKMYWPSEHYTEYNTYRTEEERAREALEEVFNK